MLYFSSFSVLVDFNLVFGGVVEKKGEEVATFFAVIVEVVAGHQMINAKMHRLGHAEDHCMIGKLICKSHFLFSTPLISIGNAQSISFCTPLDRSNLIYFSCPIEI